MLCTECGSGEVFEDGLGVEVAMVCHSCGWVNQENRCDTLISTRNPNYEYTSLEKKYRTGGSSVTRAGRTTNIYAKEMNNCIDKYSNDNEAIKKTAKDLFTDMLKDSVIPKNKKRLAVACVYVALRKFNIPISIHPIANNIGVPVNKLHKVISRVKLSIAGGVATDTTCEMKLAFGNIPSMKNRDDLEKKALKIFSLFDRLGITCGRSPSTLAAVCSYFAYVSEEKKKKRCISLRAFCSKNDAPYQTCQDLSSIAKPRLIILMKRLPWVSPSLSKHQFHIYIDDVLRYQDTLFTSYEETQPPSSVQALQAPPTFFRKMKYQPPEQWIPEASTSEVICEDDIPESEIGLYLRNSDEVSKVENIQQLLESKTD